jgi:hypothetical protein
MDRDWRGVEIISVEGAILLALALIAYGIQLIRTKTSQGKGLSQHLAALKQQRLRGLSLCD